MTSCYATVCWDGSITYNGVCPAVPPVIQLIIDAGKNLDAANTLQGEAWRDQQASQSCLDEAEARNTRALNLTEEQLTSMPDDAANFRLTAQSAVDFYRIARKAAQDKMSAADNAVTIAAQQLDLINNDPTVQALKMEWTVEKYIEASNLVQQYSAVVIDALSLLSVASGNYDVASAAAQNASAGAEKAEQVLLSGGIDRNPAIPPVLSVYQSKLAAYEAAKQAKEAAFARLNASRNVLEKARLTADYIAKTNALVMAEAGLNAARAALQVAQQQVFMTGTTATVVIEPRQIVRVSIER